MMTNTWKNDIAILCIFFARPDQFKQTFKQVKLARPRVLLLWQDGPREGRPDDIYNINECRAIAEDIDWDCEVHRMYNENNYGCDPSTFYSHLWAFSIVDKCIILEDDFVVAESFFPLCQELLEKYEYDERINRICGSNPLGVYERCPYDYFFAGTGVGGVWATWKRVADTWDKQYTFLDDDYAMDIINEKYKGNKNHKAYHRECQKFRDQGVAHWEPIVSYSQLLNSRLSIILTKNMAINIGIDKNSTHTVSDIRQMPKAVRKLFFVPLYEHTGEIKHPTYVIEDHHFVEQYNKMIFGRNQLERFGRKIESLYLKFRYGGFKAVSTSIARKLKS